jgi:periplasmic copper chaperone A
MFPTRRFLFMSVALLTAGTAALAQDAGPVAATGAWARPTAGEASTGAAYLTLTAKGTADRLLKASTPVAGMAEVHESFTENGVMKMRAVNGLPLEPGKPLELKPGGYHVMLMGLKQKLNTGDTFPLTLTFEHAAPMTVSVKVGAMGGAMPDKDMGSMKGMKDMPGMKMR